MNQGLIPRRYAKALYKVGADRKETKALYDMMRRLIDVFAAEPRLQAAVANPFVDAADKTALLCDAVGIAGDAAKKSGADGTYCDFLKLLMQNHRIDIIRLVAQAYVDIYREENHIFKVEVVSAAPLAPDEEQRLKSVVAKKLSGATMEYSSRIDPSLIGGFVVNVNSERLDASIKNELKQLRLNLIN